MATKRVQNRTETKRFVMVVGIDFGLSGDEALKAALELAKGRGADIHLLHALGKEARARLTSARAEALEARLDKVAARLRSYAVKQGLSVDARSTNVLHIRFDAPDKALIQLAVDIDADLIVVGSRGPRGLEKLLLGSVAAQVTKQAPCPVLVARPKTYAAIRRSPTIEPPCKACLVARTTSYGAVWWCPRHANESRLPMHVYSYRRELPLRTRDSGVLGATGEAIPGIG